MSPAPDTTAAVVGAGAAADLPAQPVPAGADRLLLSLLAPLRAAIRRIRSRRAYVPLPVKAGMFVLFFVPFGVLLTLVRLNAWLRGARARAGCEITAQAEHGARFVCYPNDLIQLYVWLFGVWEPDVGAFIARRLKPGDVFVDVGANIGYYSMLAAGCVGATGHVVAIEASPRIFQLLRRTLRINGDPQNVRAVQKAASDRSGTLRVFAGPDHNFGLTTTLPTRGFEAEATVAALPLGDLLEPGEAARARLVKIDVEGGEPAVLGGMASFLDACPPETEILVEFSAHWWGGERAGGGAATPAGDSAPPPPLKLFLDRGFVPYELPNNYWPWRYLWAHDVARPKRLRDFGKLARERVDLVLSRVEADEL